MLRYRLAMLLPLAALAACAPAPAAPAFTGEATVDWIAFDIPLPADRQVRDVTASFEASAHAHSCRTEPLTASSRNAQLVYGYSAECEDGTIALLAASESSVRVGCRKPTNRGKCERLLQEISESR